VHDDKQRLKVALAMAKDFLEISRACSYKNLTDIERENMKNVEVLAKQVLDDPTAYNPLEDFEIIK